MSRDLTCNETMPALDDGDSISDVRRLVNSRVINQQPFAAQINFLANSRGNTNVMSNINHTTTVRDVVSSRMRNKAAGNEQIFSDFNSSQASSSSPYWIKTSSVNTHPTENINSNFLQTLMHETNRTLSRQDISGSQYQPSASSQAQQLVSTTISMQPKVISAGKSSSNIGIAVGYNASSTSTTTSTGTSNCYISSGNGGISISTLRNAAVTTISEGSNACTSSNLAGYVLPACTLASSIGNGNMNVYSSSNFLQRSADSPGKFLISRQQLASASSSPAVIIANTGSTQFVQQPPSRPSSSFAAEMTVGSVVRASNASPSKSVINATPAGLTRGASPYAIVLPQRSDSALQSVSRESPNGCTTPTSSQIPPNSHSSPRPSILRGNSIVRRYVDKDFNTASSSNFPAVNFNAMEGNSFTSINFNSNSMVSTLVNNDDSSRNISGTVTTPTLNFVISNSSGDDSSNRQDDSPRKRQRKQQFDNSQQLQDKLMMEVRADPRFEQLGAENSTLWKLSGGLIPTASAQSLPLKSGYSSGSEFSSGLNRKEPRRRGRPRSINRNSADLYLPNSASPISALPSSSVIISSNSVSGTPLSIQRSSMNVPAVAYATAPPSSVIIAGSGAVTGSAVNNVTPRSFMVDVDSMLKVSPSKRPRKYKKRTPELNPETGEPIKKPRKKGSGRKSKKELLLLEASKKGIALNLETVMESSGSRIAQSSALQIGLSSQLPLQRQPIPSVNVFSRLAIDERSVVTTLCKFKSSLISKTAHSLDRKTAPLFVANANTDIKTKEVYKLINDSDAVEVADVATPKENKKIPPEGYADNLLNVTKYRNLRHLWKASDRNLGSIIADSFEDITNHLSRFENASVIKPRQRVLLKKGLRPSSPNSENEKQSVLCSIFETHEEFKDSLDSLRLLSTTCKYFKSSRTLIDSLRNNLYGFSAYYLAKNLISAESSTLEETLSKNDAKRAKLISGLKPNDRRLQGTCEDLFEYLYKELKSRMESSNVKANDKFPSEQELLIEFDVVGLIDSLIDRVDKMSKGESGVNVVDDGPSTSEKSLLYSTTTVFPDPLASVGTSSVSVSTFIDKLPEKYRNILCVSGSYAALANEKSKIGKKRLRRYCESSSESDYQQQSKDSLEESTDEKKLDYLLQRLHESNERSHRSYRNTRRLALRLLQQLEPEKYAETVLHKSGDVPEFSKSLKDDLETSFLLDIAKYTSTFKPLNLYNPAKSVVMRPSKEKINSIFKGEYPYSIPKKNGTADAKSFRLKSAAVERLREVENNCLVLEEIKDMEQNSTHISAVSLARLQRKYGDKREFSNMNGIIKMYSSGNSDKKNLENDSTDFFKQYCDFDRSLKRKFVSDDLCVSQLKYFQERCKETHEMAAVVVALNHSRANILRQCHDSLLEIKARSTINRQENCRMNCDSDIELDVNKTHDNDGGDDDADDSAGSSETDNEFDQSSDDEIHRPGLNRVNSPANSRRSKILKK